MEAEGKAGRPRDNVHNKSLGVFGGRAHHDIPDHKQVPTMWTMNVPRTLSAKQVIMLREV